MIKINVKTKERIIKGVKKFQPVLNKAKQNDINESDTVTIITDMLCDIFGYDKYENITSEFAIKKTYCDLAIKLDENIPLLIECKAIGMNLKDDFVRQATNYAAESGIEWVVLTNGILWNVYKISFAKSVEKELVYSFDMLELNTRKDQDVEALYYLCIEAFQKNSKNNLDEFYVQKQIFNRHIVGQLLLSDAIVGAIKRQLRKLSPETKVSDEEIVSLMMTEILKRDIVEGEDCAEAKKKVQKLEKQLAKKEQPKE